MIDVHTHILPGMDDGSKDPKMSNYMLREQLHQGVDTVVLTPHFYAHENSPREFLERREQAWKALRQVWPAPKPRLLLGAEVQYFEGMAQVEELPLLAIEGTGILLLEMPFFRWTNRMVQEVLDIQDRFPLRVLLAHLDRYQGNYTKQMLDTLLRAGVLVQVNTSALESWAGRRRYGDMIRKGQVHLLASDCHNLTSRPPNLGKWKEYASHFPAERLFAVPVEK